MSTRSLTKCRGYSDQSPQRSHKYQLSTRTLKVGNVAKRRPPPGNIFVTMRQQAPKRTAAPHTAASTESGELLMPRPVTSWAEKTTRLADAVSEAAETPDLFHDDVWNYCNDIDSFDVSRVRPGDDEKLLRTAPSDNLPASLSLEKLVVE